MKNLSLSDNLFSKVIRCGTIKDNGADYHIVYRGIDKERNCSILIDNGEYSMNKQGIATEELAQKEKDV